MITVTDKISYHTTPEETTNVAKDLRSEYLKGFIMTIVGFFSSIVSSKLAEAK